MKNKFIYKVVIVTIVVLMAAVSVLSVAMPVIRG